MSEDTSMIRVGDHRVGIVCLQEIFEGIKEQGMEGDDQLKKEIILGVRKRNYIPPSVEDDYAVALLNEYRKFLGMAVKEEKTLEIKILGSGCARCDQLKREVMNVLAELAIPADLEHVRDVSKFKDYKVFGTPALIINGQVKSVGKVPPKNEIRQWVKGSV